MRETLGVTGNIPREIAIQVVLELQKRISDESGVRTHDLSNYGTDVIA